MNKLCPNCKKNESRYSPTLGIIPCSSCSISHATPNRNVEFTTESVRQQRKQFKDEIIQPFREGLLSREYITKHGTKNLNVSEEEIKLAKDVWTSDLEYYK